MYYTARIVELITSRDGILLSISYIAFMYIAFPVVLGLKFVDLEKISRYWMFRNNIVINVKHHIHLYAVLSRASTHSPCTSCFSRGYVAASIQTYLFRVIVFRISAHVGQNHKVCLSTRGRLPRTLRYTICYEYCY